MNHQLPSIFIGSSTEGLDVAREVELHLQDDAITTIWKDGVFGLGGGILETLMNVLDQFDFAVMILSPDDLIESRSQSYASPRDNVIFELGLFMGRLGRSRVFIVHQKDANVKLPSDFAGITVAQYYKRDNLSAALGPAATLIIKAIRALGLAEHRAQRHVRQIIEDQHERLPQAQSDLENKGETPSLATATPSVTDNHELDENFGDCFVAMPYHSDFDAFYCDLALAVSNAGFKTHRIDKTPTDANWCVQIHKRIKSSAIVVAVFTPQSGQTMPNGNVMYELGLAHAWGKATLILCKHRTQVPSDMFPFLMDEYGDYEVSERRRRYFITHIENRIMHFHEEMHRRRQHEELSPAQPDHDLYQQVCFVAMPYHSDFDAFYRDLAVAVSNAGFEPHKGLDEGRVGRGRHPKIESYPLEQINWRIKSSAIVVAVFTPQSGQTMPHWNVMYELGLAHAWGKATLILCKHRTQVPSDMFPFLMDEYGDYEVNVEEKQYFLTHIENRIMHLTKA